MLAKGMSLLSLLVWPAAIGCAAYLAMGRRRKIALALALTALAVYQIWFYFPLDGRFPPARHEVIYVSVPDAQSYYSDAHTASADKGAVPLSDGAKSSVLAACNAVKMSRSAWRTVFGGGSALNGADAYVYFSHDESADLTRQVLACSAEGSDYARKNGQVYRVHSPEGALYDSMQKSLS